MKTLKEINLLDIGHKYQMVGAVYADEKEMLVCLFPEDRGTIASDRPIPVEFIARGQNEPTHEVDVLDMDHEDWKAFVRQTDLLETEILEKASDGTLAKILLRKSNRQIDQRVQWAVWRRDQFKCRYCGDSQSPLTIDHLVTWETGGPTVEANCLSSCSKDNRVRGKLAYEEWLVHPWYRERAARLDPAVRQANEALVATLAAIPRVAHRRSR